MMYKPNTVSGVFIVRASAEFWDDEATVETLCNYIEKLFEDAELNACVDVFKIQNCHFCEQTIKCDEREENKNEI